jgi:Holliday junction resolvasome RuvABC endonuclease subunit
MDSRRQRISTIKDSLQDMTLEELQNMSDDLTNLIQVLVTRQVAIEDVILERLEEAFSK